MEDHSKGSGSRNDIREDSVDAYTAGIDLLNACRRFYVSRLRFTEAQRHRQSLRCSSQETLDSGRSTLTRESVNRKSFHNSQMLLFPNLAISVELLRHEITCLIEQDVQLMRQLLMLNEQIEELKWQRKFLDYRQRSPTESGSGVSGALHSDARFSVIYSSSDDDAHHMMMSSANKYPSPSNLSMYSAETRCSEESEYSTPRQSPSPVLRKKNNELVKKK